MSHLVVRKVVFFGVVSELVMREYVLVEVVLREVVLSGVLSGVMSKVVVIQLGG